jgi:acetyl-CoA carboxylase biotin carboxyl carrier protein
MPSALDHFDLLCAWLAETDIGLLELKSLTTTLRLLQDGAAAAIKSLNGAEATQPRQPALVVRAPGPGIFLDRHPLREGATAPVGAEIVAEAPLAFLQVGPLLMPVPAPLTATVTDVLVRPGTVVGYGTPLFNLQPIGSEA